MIKINVKFLILLKIKFLIFDKTTNNLFITILDMTKNERNFVLHYYVDVKQNVN